jgi:hypothetical protein
VIIIDKTCSRCSEIKSYAQFYSQEKVNSKGDKYTYYQPYCKECAKKQVLQWESKNPDKLKQNRKKTNDNRKDKIYQYGLISQSRGSRLQWQRRNMSKLIKYNSERMEHKEHRITKLEWDLCKEYFDNGCAYCGLSYENHKKIYKQDLHREHVIHTGSNKLDNCVPSCKICNSSKKDRMFSEWYNENNYVFEQERLNKILDWLEEDHRYIMIGDNTYAN